jgi:hypothetical protein
MVALFKYEYFQYCEKKMKLNSEIKESKSNEYNNPSDELNGLRTSVE